MIRIFQSLALKKVCGWMGLPMEGAEK